MRKTLANTTNTHAAFDPHSAIKHYLSCFCLSFFVSSNKRWYRLAANRPRIFACRVVTAAAMRALRTISTNVRQRHCIAHAADMYLACSAKRSFSTASSLRVYVGQVI